MLGSNLDNPLDRQRCYAIMLFPCPTTECIWCDLCLTLQWPTSTMGHSVLMLRHMTPHLLPSLRRTRTSCYQRMETTLGYSTPQGQSSFTLIVPLWCWPNLLSTLLFFPTKSGKNAWVRLKFPTIPFFNPRAISMHLLCLSWGTFETFYHFKYQKRKPKNSNFGSITSLFICTVLA